MYINQGRPSTEQRKPRQSQSLELKFTLRNLEIHKNLGQGTGHPQGDWAKITQIQPFIQTWCSFWQVLAYIKPQPVGQLFPTGCFCK